MPDTATVPHADLEQPHEPNSARCFGELPQHEQAERIEEWRAWSGSWADGSSSAWYCSLGKLTGDEEAEERPKRKPLPLRVLSTDERRLVAGHQGLAKSQARRYKWSGIKFEDLVQAANLGLVEAAQSFDPELGEFGAFAKTYVVGALRREVDAQAWEVALPSSDRRREVDRMRNVLRRVLQTEPGLEDVATALGCEVDQVEELPAKVSLDAVGELFEPGPEEPVATSAGEEQVDEPRRPRSGSRIVVAAPELDEQGLRYFDATHEGRTVGPVGTFGDRADLQVDAAREKVVRAFRESLRRDRVVEAVFKRASATLHEMRRTLGPDRDLAVAAIRSRELGQALPREAYCEAVLQRRKADSTLVRAWGVLEAERRTREFLADMNPFSRDRIDLRGVPRGFELTPSQAAAYGACLKTLDREAEPGDYTRNVRRAAALGSRPENWGLARRWVEDVFAERPALRSMPLGALVTEIETARAGGEPLGGRVVTAVTRDGRRVAVEFADGQRIEGARELYKAHEHARKDHAAAPVIEAGTTMDVAIDVGLERRRAIDLRSTPIETPRYATLARWRQGLHTGPTPVSVFEREVDAKPHRDAEPKRPQCEIEAEARTHFTF